MRLDDDVTRRYVSTHAIDQIISRMDWVDESMEDDNVGLLLDRAVYIALDRDDRDVRIGVDTKGDPAVLVRVSQEDFDNAGGGVDGETFAMIKKNTRTTSQFKECIVTVISPTMVDRLLPNSVDAELDGSGDSALEKAIDAATLRSADEEEVNCEYELGDLIIAVTESNLETAYKRAIVDRLIGG